MLNIGDLVNIFDISYTIVKLLGHGKGGYSYLATTDNKKYVLKQIHHERCSSNHPEALIFSSSFLSLSRSK